LFRQINRHTSDLQTPFIVQGSDAIFLKEFDMLTEDFVTDAPFELPEAKTRASYKSRDVLLVGSAFEDNLEGSVTDSGYPRTVREWERGTPISEAKTVFEGEKTDVAVNVSSVQLSNRRENKSDGILGRVVGLTGNVLVRLVNRVTL